MSVTGMFVLRKLMIRHGFRITFLKYLVGSGDISHCMGDYLFCHIRRRIVMSCCRGVVDFGLLHLLIYKTQINPSALLGYGARKGRLAKSLRG